MKTFFSLILGLTFVKLVAPQPSEWKLRKNEQGIKVYTRAVTNSELEEFKAVGIVNATPAELVAHLKKVKNFPNWMPLCVKANREKNVKNGFIHYQEIEAPFPVSNRDGYYQFLFVEEGKNIRIKIKALPTFGPDVEDLVRIPSANGHYLFEALKDGRSRVTYQMLAAPGGSIPAWLANSMVVKNPFETIESLKNVFKNKR